VSVSGQLRQRPMISTLPMNGLLRLPHPLLQTKADSTLDQAAGQSGRKAKRAGRKSKGKTARPTLSCRLIWCATPPSPLPDRNCQQTRRTDETIPERPASAEEKSANSQIVNILLLQFTNLPYDLSPAATRWHGASAPTPDVVPDACEGS